MDGNLIMKDDKKTKTQLIDELTKMRQRVTQLELLEAERKETKEALRESRQLLQGIIDNTTAVIYVKDLTGRYLLINCQLETLFDLDRENVIGKTDYDIFLKELADIFRENDLKVIKTGAPVEWEEAVPHKDGVHTYISLKFPIFDSSQKPYAICGISTDITERKQSEQALRESQARFAGILEIANEAIISIDGTQRIILFNRGAENIFGFSADEAIGQPLDILLPPDGQTPHQKQIIDFSESAASARLMGHRTEIRGRRKNGEEFPAEASISKLEIGDKKTFTAVLRDITDRKQVEQEREQRINELRTLNEAARAILAELSREQVLHKIAKAARTLIKTQYAAFGVHDGHGRLSQFITVGIDSAESAKIGPAPIGRGLLGVLLKRGESVIVNDIANHPRAEGFPEYHPAMHNLLGVPIFSNGELIGVLYLTDKQDGSDFNETDRHLVEMLALHAAIAIENARLYEQTQRLAILEERERFARDLHDGIIQSIYAVGLILDQVRLDMLSENESTPEQIEVSLKSLADVIQDLRNYIFDLRPQALKYQGFTARLESLIKELHVNTLLPIEAKISPDVDDYMSDMQARHVFHICHEALANAGRHAKAKQISLSLTRVEEEITLLVEDDGVGFVLSPQIKPGHRGIANMKTRSSEIGGKLNFDSTPQQGARVTLVFRGSRLPEKSAKESLEPSN